MKRTRSLALVMALVLSATLMAQAQVIGTAKPRGPVIEVRSVEGKPVERAEVWFAETEENPLGPTLSLLRPAPSPREALLKGTRFTTDESGRVTLPAFEGEAGVLAQKDGVGWTCTLLRAPYSPHVLVFLRPERVLEVRIVGPDGKPRSGARARLMLPHQFGGHVAWEGAALGKTARMVIQNPTVIAQYDVPVAPRTPHLVLECSELERGTSVRIPEHDPPSDVVTLRMPATGTLRVKVSDEKGKRPTGSFVALAMSSPTDRTDPEFIAEIGRMLALQPNVVRRPVINGVAHLPSITLGKKVLIQVHDTEGARPPVTIVTDPPPREGARRDVAVTVTAPSIEDGDRIVADVVAARGDPLAKTELRVTFISGTDLRRQQYDLRTITDKKGRLTIPVGESAETLSSIQLWHRSGDEDARLVACDPIKLDWSKISGRTLTLSKVTLTPRKPWLTGTIRNATGQPLPGADVHIGDESLTERISTEDGRGGTSTTFGEAPPRLATRRHQRGWSVMSDLSGRWALYGDPVAGALDLHVTRDGFTTHDARIDPSGDKRTRYDVAMSRPSTVHLRVAPMAGFDPRHLVIQGPGRPARRGLDFFGRVSYDAVPAGTFRAQIMLPGREKPLAVVTHEVAGGSESGHVFVPDIVLGKQLEIRRLRITYPRGAPKPDVEAAWRSSGTQRFAGRGHAQNGVLSIPTDGSPADVVVEAPGYRVTRITNITKDRTVAMKRGIPVKLVMKSESVPPGGRHLGLRLQAPTGPEPGAPFEDGPFDREFATPVAIFEKTTELTLYLHRPGTYAVQGEIWFPELGFPTDLRIDNTNIEVKDTTQPQTFVFEVTNKDLADAVKRMR